MNEKKELIDRHLREVKAKAKSKSFEELVTRMRTEQEFRKVLDKLRDRVNYQEVLPALGTDRARIEYTPDFIVGRDEFRMPVLLIEAKKRGFSVSRDKIRQLMKYLTVANLTELILVWMSSPDFPSTALRIEEVERMVRSTRRRIEFREVRSFRDVIGEEFGRKVTSWPVPKRGEFPRITEAESLIEVLDLSFKEAFMQEAKRKRPKLPYKKDALKSIDQEDLNEIYHLIREYIQGKHSLESFNLSFMALAEIQRINSFGESIQ